MQARLSRAAKPEDLAVHPAKRARWDEIARQAGHKSFDAFLSSEQHDRIKDYVLDRDGRLCRACNRKLAKDVRYLSLMLSMLHGRPRKGSRTHPVNKRLERVVALCPSCHYYSAPPGGTD